jgi:hypothetical protein
MLIRLFRALVWGALLAPVLGIAAGVPFQLPYSGAVNVRGEPFNGTGQFKFAIVNQQCALAQNGCVTLWSNDNTSLTGAEPTNGVSIAVTQGRYSIKLGDIAYANMTAIPAAAFENENTYLRVWFTDGINGYQQLTPDRQFVSVPYAYRAKAADSADTVAAGAVGAAQINTAEVQTRVTGNCTGQVVTGVNQNGALTCEADNGEVYSPGTGISISGGVVGIANSGVTSAQLADGAVLAGKIADSAVTGAKIAAGSVNDSKITDVNWAKLAGMPASIADGDDNTTYTSSAPIALTGTNFNLAACGANQIYKMVDGVWTCATDVDTNTTYTAGTGLSLSGTQFLADTLYLQQRVGGTCPAGFGIRVIQGNGSVICEEITGIVSITLATAGETRAIFTNPYYQVEVTYTPGTSPGTSALTTLVKQQSGLAVGYSFHGGADGERYGMITNNGNSFAYHVALYDSVALDVWYRDKLTIERIDRYTCYRYDGNEVTCRK